MTRLKPLCDALKVNLNELIAGEDIGESVLPQKMEENIMSLVKENEVQKKNGKVFYIGGVALTLLAVCLLGVSLNGSSAQTVWSYFDFISILFLALFIGCGVLLGKDKSKTGIWNMIQKMSIPAAAFISLFQTVFILLNYTDASKLGPSLALVILSMLYGVGVYMVAAVVKTHLE